MYNLVSSARSRIRPGRRPLVQVARRSGRTTRRKGPALRPSLAADRPRAGTWVLAIAAAVKDFDAGTMVGAAPGDLIGRAARGFEPAQRSSRLLNFSAADSFE